MSSDTPPATATVRSLRQDDLAEVARIDALHTGQSKHAYWRRIFDEYLGPEGRDRTFGFGIESEDGLAGFLFGEIRAVEFGSGPCGWVFALGIEDGFKRRGLATALLDAARRRFRESGVEKVRTMVRRNDVPFLSFFRSSGFVGGPYVQLELNGQEEES